MKLRIFVLFAVALALGAAWQAGLYEQVRDPAVVRAWLTENGPWGPLLYVLVFALLEPVGVPGAAFVIPASWIWPFWQAVALSVTGAVLAGVVGWGFARWVAHDFVQARLPPRIRRYAEATSERELRTVIVVRLLFFLAAPAHWALGIAGIRLHNLVLGSAIGFFPAMVAMVAAGAYGGELLKEQPRELWWLLGGLVAAALLGRWLWRRRRGHATFRVEEKTL